MGTQTQIDTRKENIMEILNKRPYSALEILEKEKKIEILGANELKNMSNTKKKEYKIKFYNELRNLTKTCLVKSKQDEKKERWKKTLTDEKKVFILKIKDKICQLPAKDFLKKYGIDWGKGGDRNYYHSYYFATPLTHKWKNPLEEIKSELIRRFDIFLSKEKINELNDAFDAWILHAQQIEMLPKPKKPKPQEVKRKEEFPLSEDLINSLKTLKQHGAIKEYKINQKDKIVEITRADFLVHKPVKYTQKQLERVQKFREDHCKEFFKKYKGEEHGFGIIQNEYYKKYFWCHSLEHATIVNSFFKDFDKSLDKLHELILALPKSVDQEKINNFVKIYKLKSLG